jgi:hypothetical protein
MPVDSLALFVGGEDPPGDQVGPDRSGDVLGRDLAGEERHQCPEREPEGPERGEGDGAEGVAGPELPHSRQDLRDPAIGEGDAEHDGLAGDRLPSSGAPASRAGYPQPQRAIGGAQKAKISEQVMPATMQ